MTLDKIVIIEYQIYKYSIYRPFMFDNPHYFYKTVHSKDISPYTRNDNVSVQCSTLENQATLMKGLLGQREKTKREKSG